jgi:aspartyl-tRNA(Asn)/glutamyl-tRNA(Gln) amidotransferase subunit A
VSTPGAGSARWLTATDLHEAYAAGRLDPVGACEEALAAVEQHDGQVNAFVSTEPEDALAAARASARRWEAGRPLGPADGIPTTVKDIFVTAGRPTLPGSSASPTRLPSPGFGRAVLS